MIRYLILAACLLSLTAAAPADDAKETLWDAARKGDAATVKKLIDDAVDVNAKTPYGATALSFAADKGHLAVVKLLIQAKPKPKRKAEPKADAPELKPLAGTFRSESGSQMTVTVQGDKLALVSSSATTTLSKKDPVTFTIDGMDATVTFQKVGDKVVSF